MKRRLGQLCLITLSVGVWVGTMEGLIRIFAPHVRDTAMPPHLFVIDTQLGWRFAPSRTATHKTRYFNATYTISSDGFRDGPRRRLARSGTRRVLLYGDSLVFGWGLNEGARFSDLLENAVPGLEVVNHAVPGYGLDQEVILYDHEGGSVDADEVIFFVATSTLSRLDTGFIYSKYKPRFTLQRDGSLTLVPIPRRRATVVSFTYKTLSPLYLPYLIETKIARVRERVTAFDAGDDNVGPDSAPLVDDLAKNVLRLAWTTAQKRGHDVTILLADLSRADRHALHGLCTETGIACVDIFMELQEGGSASGQSAFVFGPDDRHWNARAHEVIAAHLQRQMTAFTPGAVTNADAELR